MLTSIRPRIVAPGASALLASVLTFTSLSAFTRADDPPSSAGARTQTPQLASRDATASRPAADQPVEQALRAIADCQRKYAEIHDYTCKFVKRERIDGRLHAQHVMLMKVRTRPKSLYFKFHAPNKGREAIYVAGRHNDKVVAHDVGLGRLLAGTMNLDPNGATAMEANRHPVTEAGIGALIDNIAHYLGVGADAGRIARLHQPRDDDRPAPLHVDRVDPSRA